MPKPLAQLCIKQSFDVIRCRSLALRTKLELPKTFLERRRGGNYIVAGSVPKVVVLAGPTAVGKTQLSLALAIRLNGEVISADSLQVYKGLDVRSAKVCAALNRFLVCLRLSMAFSL